MKSIDTNRKNILRFIIPLLFSLFVFSGAVASEKIKIWKDGEVRIELKEYLDIPEMKWPETLLHYKLDLNKAGIRNPDSLVLLDDNNRSVPFQLRDMKMENGSIRYATLCFFSALSAGEIKNFRLILRLPETKYEQSALPGKVVTRSSGADLLLDNGLVRLQINKEQPDSGSRKVFSIGTASEWLGEMLLPAGVPLTGYALKPIATGDLFSEYRLDIRLNGSIKYSVIFRLIAGMDYVEMDEEMTGFETDCDWAMEMFWINFRPKKRYCPTRSSQLDKKGRGFDNFSWEPMEGLPTTDWADKHPLRDFDQQNAPDGKLPFRLSSYHNWMTWWRLPTAAFWNEKENCTVGIYIRDFEKWKDPSYPLWGSKEYLSVGYYYKNNRLSWKFPLVNGERSVSIALYPHTKDRELVDATNKPQVYVDYLRRWYGWISLDKTKDWILDYESAKSVHPPFYACEGQTMKADPKGVVNKFRQNVQSMATAGERAGGPTPVGAREYLEHLSPLFELSERQLSPEEYRKSRARYLFMNYVFMDEALMPMRTLLSGHPNFLGDLKSIPGGVAFLFPDHPQARDFADHFEKSIALNLNYHIRPDVKIWDARGGRSTENLSCYTWAFLRPTLKTSFMLHHFYDGKNRMLQPNISLYGNWLLNVLTAPLDALGNRRALLPQGAHARKNGIPNYLNILGQELKNYDPLLAEHLFWETRPDDESFETGKSHADPWDVASASFRPYEKGTNPGLQSAKYTGYGFVLRRNYGEKDEMYVNLQQIDDGPNYRWGRAGKGGNGVIYYYAGGKRYSHNGTEDVGDAPFGDTDRCSNFGVKKEGIFRSLGTYSGVGRNDLTEPLFDFGFAQFASVNASKEVDSHYTSRSVLMADRDYIVVFDDVARPDVEGRFSWFVGINDDFPSIFQLKPAVKSTKADMTRIDTPYHKDPESPETKGVQFDGKGDFLTLITHKTDLDVRYEPDVCRVKHPSGVMDWIFRSDRSVSYSRQGVSFEGTAGFVRKQANNVYQAALFEGSRLSVPGITIMQETDGEGNGISLEAIQGRYKGTIYITHTTRFRLTTDKKVNDSYRFYLNGLSVTGQKLDERSYLVNLDPGRYDWQLTDKGVVPGQPLITGCISGRDWCEIAWQPVPGALSYQVCTSADYGATWNLHRQNITSTVCKLEKLGENKKIHVRVTAKAEGGTGTPTRDYPIYLSAEKPHAPEGLRVETDKNGVAFLSWGQILGAGEYTLYSRKQGQVEYQKVYRGKERNTKVLLENDAIYEFVVTATNGIGESDKSIVVDSDPSRMINWYPVPGEKFRRDPENQENGYTEFNPWIEDTFRILTYPE